MKEISVMQKSMVLSCLATLVGSGCISAARPPMVATATGERLEVVDDVVKWTTQEKVQVGEVEFTDDKGKSEGKAKVYENQQKQHSVNIWYPVQGTQALSDEEFFQIAGDTSALDRTLKLRSEGEQRQTTGHYLIGGGAALAVAGLVLNYAANTSAGLYVMMAGGAGISGGYYYSMLGARMMSKDTHAVERADAVRAAQGYNARNGHTVGVSGTF
jgi:hypothetical protein